MPMTGWSRAIRARDPAIATAGTPAHAVTTLAVTARRLGRRDRHDRRDLGDSARSCSSQGPRGLTVGAVTVVTAVTAVTRRARVARMVLEDSCAKGRKGIVASTDKSNRRANTNATSIKGLDRGTNRPKRETD